MATNRVEKYKGVTLVVRDNWISVVWDKTGHILEGPVSTDEDVRRVARLAVDVLRKVAEE